MSEDTRRKWDARYRQIAHRGQPSAVLSDKPHLIPRHGRALDLACGLGANALFLAAHNLEVEAWDISPVAIERLGYEAHRRGLSVNAQVRDVIAHPPEPDSYDLIVVSRFLSREICPAICRALRPGGVLFYQTYTRSNNVDKGPRNPLFLLEKGELLRLFGELQTVFYLEGDEVLLIGQKG